MSLLKNGFPLSQMSDLKLQFLRSIFSSLHKLHGQADFFLSIFLLCQLLCMVAEKIFTSKAFYEFVDDFLTNFKGFRIGKQFSDS